MNSKFRVKKKLFNGFSVLFLSVCLMNVTGLARATAKGETLLQQGILKQTAERDFSGAVELFQQAMQASPGDPVAVQAALHLGLCYETMDKKHEAASAFESVLTLAGSESAEARETAQLHLQRLERELTAAAAVQGPVAIELEKEPRWEAAIELGRAKVTYRPIVYGVSADDLSWVHVVPWLSLGYRVSNWFSVGAEGGIFAPKSKATTYTFDLQTNTVTDSRSAGEFGGLYGQLQYRWKRWRPAFRLGVGVNSQKQSAFVQNTFFSESGDSITLIPTISNRIMPAMALSAALEYFPSKKISVGLGVRDVMSFNYETSVNYDGISPSFHTVLVTEHVWIPFLRAGVYF